MSQRAHLILSWVIVALWAGVIFFMSAHTGSDFDGTGPLAAIKRWLVGLVAPIFGPDTDIVNVAAHFTEYLIFGVLLVVAARRTWKVPSGVILMGPVVQVSSSVSRTS